MARSAASPPPDVRFDRDRGIFVYVVRPQDTMASIADGFGESPLRIPSLAHANPTVPRSTHGRQVLLHLQPGMEIRIPDDWVTKDPRPTAGTLRAYLASGAAALSGTAQGGTLGDGSIFGDAGSDLAAQGWTISLSLDEAQEWTQDTVDAILSSAPAQMILSAYQNGIEPEAFVNSLRDDQSQGEITACEVTKVVAKVFLLCPFISLAFILVKLPQVASYCGIVCGILSAIVGLVSFPLCERELSIKLVKEIWPDELPPSPDQVDIQVCIDDPTSVDCYNARGGAAYCMEHGADPACLAQQDRLATGTAPGGGGNSGGHQTGSGGQGNGSGSGSQTSSSSSGSSTDGGITTTSAPPSTYEAHKTAFWVVGATAIGAILAGGVLLLRDQDARGQ